MIKHSSILIFSFLIILIQSCGINSDLMLKTPNDYVFDDLNLLLKENNNDEYVIKINDIVQFKFYTNNANRILDISAGTAKSDGNVVAQLNATNNIFYVINTDSLVKLPYISYVNIVGKTIIEAEEFLQNKYKTFYVEPFVQLSITNKRIFVFPGSGADAKVVNLTNNNTTLMEAIALAGGIRKRGRASKIKLIRGVGGVRKVYLINLATIEGLKYVDLIVQNGDFIYVEPVPQLGREILSEIAPVVSIVTSAVILITAFNQFK